jgi:hypothetical protein
MQDMLAIPTVMVKGQVTNGRPSSAQTSAPRGCTITNRSRLLVSVAYGAANNAKYRTAGNS